MLSFKPISPQDYNQLFPIIEQTAEPICDICFSNMYGWAVRYNTSWTIAGTQTLVIRFTRPGRSTPPYLCPFCNDNESWSLAINQLSADAHEGGYPLHFMGVTEGCRNRLELLHPGRFAFSYKDGFQDYLYRTADLAELRGKKYQPKRNHINKFKSLYPEAQYQAISPADTEQIGRFADFWLSTHPDPTEDLHYENRVIHRLLEHYAELHLYGGFITLNQEVIAFTLGAPITPNVLDVQIEKARPDIEGAYTMINNCFAASLVQKYEFLNREEDLGLPGLRQAKQSYKPVRLLAKGSAVEID